MAKHQLSLSESTYQALITKAASKGMSIEEWLVSIIARDDNQYSVIYHSRTPEERAQHWQEVTEKYAVPNVAVRDDREGIYQGYY